MLVTANYHDWELVVSEDHPELAYKFDEVPAHLLANAMRLLMDFGQPSRDLAGEHTVLSFIRTPALTAAIPGAKVGGSHESGLAMDFRPKLVEPMVYWELATSGALADAGCRWDKLNMYTNFDPFSFHVAIRPAGAGPAMMRLYRDWERVN